MADHNDSKSKGAKSAMEDDITDPATVDKKSEGKFVFENSGLMFHKFYDYNPETPILFWFLLNI